VADFANVKIFTIEAVVAVASDRSDSAPIASESGMYSFTLDLFSMDKGINVFFKVTLVGVTSVDDLSSVVDENQVGDAVALVIFDGRAFLLGHMVMLDVKPILFG
jgi:hypothetical protein